MASEKGPALANWHYHFANFHYSSKEFYEKLKNLIADQNFPDVKGKVVPFPEGGATSAKRDYLSIIRHQYRFDICAAPFGKSFFISWWLSEPPGCMPNFFGRRIQDKTFYQIDTETIFKASIHALIVEVIDDITSQQTFRLPDSERTLPRVV